MSALSWIWLLAVLLRPSSQDSVADVILMMSNVDSQNCTKLPIQLKILPRHSVVEYESGYSAPIPDFQATLDEARKLALNRAIFFSYTSQLIAFWSQPESSYYHLSALSNLLSENQIIASGILFDKNKMKANWLSLNWTLPRYGPYAYRISNNSFTFRGSDIGANFDYLKDSYTLPKPWYNVWMFESPAVPKATKINVTLINEDGTTKSKYFYGPPQQVPVKLSQPYYECEQMKQWIISATSPVVFIDFKEGDLAAPRIQYIAIATSDLSYMDIDINPCPGNESRNIFAGSARCKDTTKCKPLGKFGVHRGSYECYCKLGYRYPDRQDGSFLGEEIENVTSPEYSNPANFNCLKIIAPRISDPSEDISDTGNNTSMPDQKKILNDSVLQLVNKIHSISPSNCSTYAEKLDLGFSYKLTRTIKKQFVSQARSALRLAHFLSSFLQNLNLTQTDYTGWNNRSLSPEMMYGELIAILMSDNIIKVASISFEENILFERRFFAAASIRQQNDFYDDNKSHIFSDLVIKHYLSNYTAETWYQRLKQKKQTPKLYEFSLELEIRTDGVKPQLRKLVPLIYKSVNIDYASQAAGPLYDCFFQSTLIWFDVPFFTKSLGNNMVKLGGFVSVGIDAQLIDINQCGDAEDELFRGTNLCDKGSTKCVPIRNSGFRPGGYRCECNPGYEYPYNGSNDYFVGHIMEKEYLKYLDGKDNILNLLKCRKVNNQWTTPPIEKLDFPARKPVNTVLSSIEDQNYFSGATLAPSANDRLRNVNNASGTRISFIWGFVWILFYIIL